MNRSDKRSAAAGSAAVTGNGLHPLAALVPHRPPMLLLDELLEGNADRARAAFTVRPDNRLLENNQGLPSWTLLEHFAQTAALIGGLRARETGAPIGQGFLLGTRKIACPVSHIPVGTRLVLEAETGFVDGNGMGAYHCRCVTEGYPISCTLTVYTPPQGSENHE